MSSVSQNSSTKNTVSNYNTSFFMKFKIYAILKSCNAYKLKGFPVIDVFKYLFELVFSNKSMYMNICTGTHKAPFAKDTVYRMLKSTSIHWQKFITLLGASIITTIKPLTSDDREDVFVVDDTFYDRKSSKKVELATIVHDHTDNRYKTGFRLLTLGWSDGQTFLPVNYSLLSSEKNSKHYQSIRDDLDKRSIGFKRREQAQKKSPVVMLELIDAALKAGITAKYTLFDSWFSYPATLIAIKNKGLQAIGRGKNTKKIYYLVNGETKTLAEIYSSQKKRRGRSKYLLSAIVEIQKDDIIIPLKIVFVRNHANRKKWIALLCTDTSLTEEDIIRIYGKRWDIEVFFKVCKSYLKLAKEFRVLSYDALTAHTALVYSRFMMLAVENRNQKDQRTLGQIFFLVNDELSDIIFSEALQLLFETMLQVMDEVLFLTKKQLNTLLNTFIMRLPASLRRYLSSMNKDTLPA